MKYYLLNRENNYFEFESLEKLLAHLNNDFTLVGHNWNEVRIYWDDWREFNSRHVLPIQYIVFDEMWRIVSVEYLKNESEKFDRDKFYKSERNKRLKEKYQYTRFRIDPIPRTGKCKNHRRWSRFAKSERQEKDSRFWNRILHSIRI